MHHALAVYLTGRSLVFFGLQFSLGCFIVTRVVKKSNLLLLHSFAVLSIIDFLLFFVFLRNPKLGSDLSTLIMVLGSVALLPNALRFAKNKSYFLNYLIIPLAIWGGVALFYGSFFASC